MKHTIKLVLVISIFTISNQASAQDDAKPNFMVFQQNQVAAENMATLNALQDSLFTPLLNQLVDEGMLMGWGQLLHSWGDEWNYNFYFETQNHRAFLDFWAEYIRRFTEQNPGLMQELQPMFSAHKDNFYWIRTMR